MKRTLDEALSDIVDAKRIDIRNDNMKYFDGLSIDLYWKHIGPDNTDRYLRCIINAFDKIGLPRETFLLWLDCELSLLNLKGFRQVRKSHASTIYTQVSSITTPYDEA